MNFDIDECKLKIEEVYIEPFQVLNKFIKQDNNLFGLFLWTIVKILLLCITIFLTPIIFIWYILFSSIKLNGLEGLVQ